jgi:hypothetical protein
VLVGLWTGTMPTLAEFSFDLATLTASWRFDSWNVPDQYLISVRDSVTDTEDQHLDGEWVNPVSLSTVNSLVSEFPSGDGNQGGSFNFVATIFPGDANLDNIVTSTDYGILADALSNIGYNPSMGPAWFAVGDMDGDGYLDEWYDADIIYTNMYDNLQNLFMRGDLDGDFDIDDADLDILANNLGLTSADYADGDLNGDGTVDVADFDMLYDRWGMALVAVE